MKKLQSVEMEMVVGGSGNCVGTYRSCLNAAAAVGMGFLFATAGAAGLFGVVIAGFGMEYCRQQAIACYG